LSIKIGFTGFNCSGKDTAADILVEIGFKHFSLSDIIRDEIKELGLEENRETLIYVGNDLRKNLGNNILAKRTNEKIKDLDKAVISSIRNEFEVEELRKNKDFILVSIEASIELRFKRAMDRKRIENIKTLDDFKKIDEKESSDDPGKQQLHKIKEMADYNIPNNGSLDELREKILNLIKKLSE